MPAELCRLLLFCATCSALAPHFRAGSAQPEDTASIAAAEALLLRLLGQARSAAQLRALQALLDSVWDSGYAFDVMPQQPSAQHGVGPLPDKGSGQLDEGDLQKGPTSFASPGMAVLRPVEPTDPGEQPVKPQGSAPGTPPAEESRWPTSGSQLDAADGWDEAEQLQPSGEQAVHQGSPACALDGWEAEGIHMVLPALAHGALRDAQDVKASESETEQKTSGSTFHTAEQAADALPAADGWEADEGLALPPAAPEDACSVQGAASEAQDVLLSTGQPASDALSNSWDGDADLPEASTSSAVVNEHPTQGACIDHAEASLGADAGKGPAQHAIAGEVLSAGSSQSYPGSHLSAGQLQSSSGSSIHDKTAKGDAVPMHACWSALLQRMLAASDRQLAGCVLARLERARAQQAVLVSEAEADALVRASARAGE